MKELAQGIASLGRGPDTELVHMTKGEVAGLQHLALAHGGSLTINPHTGLPEAGFLSSILPMLAGAAANFIFPGAGMIGTALAGGVTGALLNKNRGMGAITGALGGVGGGNLAGTLAGAGEAAASAEAAKQAAEAGTSAFNTAMQVPTQNFIPENVQTALANPEVSGMDTAAYQQALQDKTLQAEMARAGAIDNYAPPQQSYFDKLQKGITNPPADFFKTKKNYVDMGMAAAPLAMGMFGGGPSGGVGSSGLPYSTSSVPFSKAQASTRETRFQDPNAPYGPEYAYFTGNRTYGPGNSLANYGAAEGGLASLKGFADGGGVEYPDLNFFQPQPRTDTLQQKVNYFGEPEGYADGGLAMFPQGSFGGRFSNPSTPIPSTGRHAFDEGTGGGGPINMPTRLTSGNMQAQANSMGLGTSNRPEDAGIQGGPMMGMATPLPAMPRAPAPPPGATVINGQMMPRQGSVLNGGMATQASRFQPRYNRENSGFFDQMPRRQAPASGAGIPASGGYVPFSLYGPGGFKPAAAQVAPPTQAQATAASPPPAPAAPTPVPTYVNSASDQGMNSGVKEGGRIRGGIADLTPTYAAGGRLLRGPGDGVSDSIPAVITGPRPQRAALADGEFVVPARIVSELGNGSTEAGARKLYAMMDRVQHARRKSIGKGKVAVNSRAEKLLPA
jgi:hypothetical protein